MLRDGVEGPSVPLLTFVLRFTRSSVFPLFFGSPDPLFFGCHSAVPPIVGSRLPLHPRPMSTGLPTGNRIRQPATSQFMRISA